MNYYTDIFEKFKTEPNWLENIIREYSKALNLDSFQAPSAPNSSHKSWRSSIEENWQMFEVDMPGAVDISAETNEDLGVIKIAGDRKFFTDPVKDSKKLDYYTFELFAEPEFNVDDSIFTYKDGVLVIEVPRVDDVEETDPEYKSHSIN